MNISEHLALFVKDYLGCTTVFTLTGGGAMFLNDAFGNTEGLSCIYNHHEQAAAMAALGYSKSHGIGVCVTTTGCGATNAITGLLDAWQDSQPVLFISGQVKKKETTFFSGLPLRSFGVQELDIIPIVESLTKQALCLGSKKDYFECLQKIHEWLFSGRPGPVWIDIPMDIQSQQLTPEEVETALRNIPAGPSWVGDTPQTRPGSLKTLTEALYESEKPVFLVGNGLRLSNNGKGILLLQEYCVTHNIPIVATYLAADFFPNTMPNYLGVAGLKAARRANIALYNSDLIIAIGTRLATSVIGFEYEKFAPNAKLFVVDIDEIEHKKNTRSLMSLVWSDAYAFLDALSSSYEPISCQLDKSSWLNSCCKLKELLPVQEQFSPEGFVSIYDVVKCICDNFGSNDTLVSDAGSAYYVASIMFNKNTEQRYITSGAQADMGFSLPASIGVAASLSSSTGRVHAITGDGSFQLNLQEIQTLVTNRLPVTLYILNNKGYLSIRATQSAFFAGRECGTGPSSGVDFPSIKLLCKAYDIEYRYASSKLNIVDIVEESRLADYPIICEVDCPENEAIVPRTKTVKKVDGTLESAPLCSMQPDLPAEITNALNRLGFIC
jgi:acetolactate synthase-1/2/3 large subunit